MFDKSETDQKMLSGKSSPGNSRIELSESAADSGWLVAGLGTPSCSDDEIGLALVRALSRDADYTNCCILMEYADAAMVASSLMEWHRPVLWVDAADMGLGPGEYRLFSDKEAAMTLKTSSVSTHGLGLAEGLELARTLGYKHPLRIFGVQPFDLSPKQGLTREMSKLFPSLLAALRNSCSRLRQQEAG
jgi:hydrogenase maturation protease